MAANIVEATQYENAIPEHANDKAKTHVTHEPEDLYMVLGRDSAAENAMSSWTHEMDYDNDLLSAEVNGRQSGVETVAAGDKLPSNGMDTKANLVEIQEEKFLVEKKVQEFQLLERANLT